MTDRDSDLLSLSCVQTQSQPVGKPTTEGNDTVMTGVTDTNNKTTTQAQSQPVMKSATEGNDTVMTGVSDNRNTTSHTAQPQSQPVMTTEGNDMLANQPQLLHAHLLLVHPSRSGKGTKTV